MQDLRYAYPLRTVFPETISTIPGSESVTPSNGAECVKSGLLDSLRVIDYRYNRFALDPRTGLFAMIRYVKQSPSSIAVQVFLSEDGPILSGPP